MQDKDKYLEISKHFISAFRTDRNSTIEDNVQLHRTKSKEEIAKTIVLQERTLDG